MRTMITRFRTTVILGALVMAMVGLQAGTASASPGSFAFTFTGEAGLPEFPDADGSSTGSFHASVNGSGVVGGRPVTATDTTPLPVFHDGHNLHAHSFNYSELPAACPLHGTADGDFVLRTDSSGDIDGHLSWTRLGATAVITLDSVNGAGFTDAFGAATAVFAMDPTAVLCTGGPVRAIVVGSGFIGGTD